MKTVRGYGDLGVTIAYTSSLFYLRDLTEEFKRFTVYNSLIVAQNYDLDFLLFRDRFRPIQWLNFCAVGMSLQNLLWISGKRSFGRLRGHYMDWIMQVGSSS